MESKDKLTAYVQPETSPMVMNDTMVLMPVEQQEEVLTEYDKRRQFFFKWIKDKFVEGVHFGFPPGRSIFQMTGPACPEAPHPGNEKHIWSEAHAIL